MSAIVVMGVAGAGKSVVGRMLAEAAGLSFVDGDDLHPAANVAKMSRGEPLQDADRWPWLEAVGRTLAGGDTVVACSALKRAYREAISRAAGCPVRFVFLDGDRETLAARLGARKGHFMPPALLDSQLAILERPGADEPATRVSIEPAPEVIVAEIVAQLGLGGAARE